MKITHIGKTSHYYVLIIILILKHKDAESILLCCAVGCEVDGPALSSPWAEQSFSGDPQANFRMHNNQN